MSRSTSPTLETRWHALSPLWQGNSQIIKTGLPHEQLAPAWQILMLGDGSPTRHLTLLTREVIEVDVIDMAPIGMAQDDAPAQIEVVPGPRLRRQVWLRTASGQRLAYAVSWWDASQVDDYLQNRALPIWDNLSQLHSELYRDIQGIYYGDSAALAAEFQETGPFWGRHYLFWHSGQPLTLIYEVFSPYLQRYLGAMGGGDWLRSHPSSR
ncbi:chorismate lyase [Spirulina major CS-329]|uniref:chorismate lyase n=1 Tax=Spirulina TaxID=1154 RepID=UPI00232AF14F|nr:MULTISPECIES: chorismate lyase [Spirulina]MDB9495292.1 chorismate lyase [Spirulina subsalsa CS-330]MDB9502099.1 chorismate lyase [Spirulina major CS-329]